MRLLHHRDLTHHRTAAPHTADPVAVAVWRGGLNGAVAAGALVIRAPHASELVDPRAATGSPTGSASRAATGVATEADAA